jgi:hypothetical protein
MEDTIELKKIRKTDPFLDRRSGEDRREAYDLDYFRDGGAERRKMSVDSHWNAGKAVQELANGRVSVRMKIRSYLKNVFWSNFFVGASF